MTKLYLICSDSAIVLLSIILIGGFASSIREMSIKANVGLFGYNIARFIDHRLMFIGVVHHECSHLLMGILSGAKIKDFALFRVKGGTLGHVDIIPRGPFVIQLIQRALCGMAPIICGSMTLYGLYYYGLYTREVFDYTTVIAVLLMMQISYHMSMSKQDVKIAFGGVWVIYLILFVIHSYVRLNYEAWKGFILVILAILCLNLMLSLTIRLITVLKH